MGLVPRARAFTINVGIIYARIVLGSGCYSNSLILRRKNSHEFTGPQYAYPRKDSLRRHKAGPQERLAQFYVAAQHWHSSEATLRTAGWAKGG